VKLVQQPFLSGLSGWSSGLWSLVAGVIHLNDNRT